MAQATIETTVAGIQGIPVSATPPTVNQQLVYNGTNWVPMTLGPFLPLAGGGIVNGSIQVGDLDLSLSASAVGSLIAGTVTTNGNFAINTYIDASGTWHQMPGTGAGGGGYGAAILAAGTSQIYLYWNAAAADNAPISLQTIATFAPSGLNLIGQISATVGNFTAGPSGTPLNLSAGGAGSGDCIVNWTVPTIATWAAGIQASTGDFYIQQTVPPPGITAFSMTNLGVLQLGQGMQCKAGASGGFTGNVHNIEWAPTAYLWIDGVNQGALAFQSDYRLKRNMKVLDSMWAKIKALRPISYTQAEYAPPGTNRAAPMFPADDVERWGFIAHELQETLLPSAASGVKDQPDLIQSPNPLTLLACVTKALQEAMARIEVLEGKIA